MLYISSPAQKFITQYIKLIEQQDKTCNLRTMTNIRFMVQQDVQEQTDKKKDFQEQWA